MIKIVAKNIVKEDCIHEFMKYASKLIEESRKETGCKQYGLFQDISNPFVLTFIEEWRDEDAIKAHNNSEHFVRIVPKLKELVLEPTDVVIYKSAQ